LQRRVRESICAQATGAEVFVFLPLLRVFSRTLLGFYLGFNPPSGGGSVVKNHVGVDEGNPLLDYFMANGGLSVHKWVDYFEVYHRAFAQYRGKPITFLEIGVQNGGSAHMWRQYFGPSARIIGVDIDPECKALEKDGFEIWIGDQADPEFWGEFCQANPTLDLVLDDGGHTMEQQLVTLNALFPILSDRGTYLCEDVHTSYFPAYGGGLRQPETFVEIVKMLIDDMHSWYYAPLKDLAESYMANNLYSLSIYESIVVMEKRRKNLPLALARGNGGNINNPPAMTCYDLRRACGIAD
jgi:hypothetical protein